MSEMDFNGTRERPAAEPQDGWLRLPPEGLASIVAVGAMLVAVGLAVDQAAWAGHIHGSRATQTVFLPIGMLLAGVIGGVLGRARIGPLKAHFIGAFIGALFLLNAAAASVSSASSLSLRMEWLAWSVNNWAWESFVLGIRSNETAAFLLLLGALLWGVGQLGAFSVFRRQRPLPLIVLGLTALLVNMSVTVHDQLFYLVVFAAGALLLVVRLNLQHEAVGWRARRLVEIDHAGYVFLSRGAVFVGLAVVLSITLAGTASSAPLARAWRDMDSRLLDLGYEVNRWLGGVSGPTRGMTNLFGSTQTLRDVWESSSEPVFTAHVSDNGSYYWRGATYDSFDGRAWQQLDPVTSIVPAGDTLLAASQERLAELKGRRQISIAVTSLGLGGDVIVVPESPLIVDRPTELQTHRGNGGFVRLRLSEGLYEGTTYAAIAFVNQEAGPDRLTASQLASAGTDYPIWLNRYLEIRPGSIGDRTRDEAARLVDALPRSQRDPYHIAEAIQNWFWRDGGFEYSTDLRGLCSNDELVDCFLETKVGYCERFATAMTMMLRSQGIPARYAVGFLPGQRTGETSWQVDRTASHAWVEVYFPGYGWQRFDPTPGNTVNGQQPTQLEPGSGPGPGPGASPTLPPVPSPTADDDDLIIPDRGNAPLGPGSTPGTQTGPDAPLVLLLVLLTLGLAAAGVLLFARRRGTPSIEPGRAYAGLVALASRLGHPPRPAQTVYEYTGGLAQLVPAIETDLRTLALAKVEATYGPKRRSPGLGTWLVGAYRRARMGLLRLIVRPPRWLRAPTQVRRRRS
jgi:transglutaminase-like putative cysteine protease